MLRSYAVVHSFECSRVCRYADRIDDLKCKSSMTAESLISKYGSPLYVYDAEVVRRAFQQFQSTFDYTPRDFHYAIVCNKNAYLVRLLYDLGCGVHANTPGDAHAALAAGIPAHRILYSGTNLNRADFDYLIGHSIRLNLDSLDQLRDLANTGYHGDVGLRLLIDDEDRPNRIGVAPPELTHALEIAGASGLRLVGLHMYAGTNTSRVERFLACLDRLVESSDLLPDLDYLDIGGGYGVAYKDGATPLDVARLGREVSNRMAELSRNRGRPIRLFLEPGRTLVARAASLFTTVVSVKERGGRRFVGVDTTIGNIVVESVYHSFHRIEAVPARGPLLDVPTDVCGNTTHSRDYLARSCRLPKLQPGDLLVVRDVGAYGYAMSSHFLNRPRPAEVVLDGGEVILTTRREGFADLMATQVIL